MLIFVSLIQNLEALMMVFSYIRKTIHFLARSNSKVLAHFIAAGNHQGALDYFGFEGSYDPDISTPSYVPGGKSYYGVTDALTGEISYGDLAFSSYDNLLGTYYKEIYSSMRVKSGIGIERSEFPINGTTVLPEEAKGFRYAYYHNGLFSKSTVDFLNLANQYWLQVGGEQLIQNKWWNFIYRLPRRY